MDVLGQVIDGCILKQVGFLKVVSTTNFGAQFADLTTQLRLLENRLNTKQVLL